MTGSSAPPRPPDGVPGRVPSELPADVPGDLARGAGAPAAAAAPGHLPAGVGGRADDLAHPAPVRRTLWEEGRQPAVVVVGAAVALTAAVVALDVAALSGPGVLFGLGFVVVSVAAALAVRPRDFFAVGVLPPLLMLAVFVVLGVTRPETVADPGYGTVQAVVSGLSHHSLALGVGYALCLAVLGVRDRFARGLLGPGRRTPR